MFLKDVSSTHQHMETKEKRRFMFSDIGSLLKENVEASLSVLATLITATLVSREEVQASVTHDIAYTAAGSNALFQALDLLVIIFF